MRLVTARLTIAPLGAADIDAFVAYRREPEVARYQGWTTDYSRTDAERLVATQPDGWPAPGEWLQLALHGRGGDDGAPVGVLVGDVAVGAHAHEPHTVELDVTLAPAWQGRGFAREALDAVRAAVVARGVDRIVMHADARNAPVLHLIRALGLRHEASLTDTVASTCEPIMLERFAQRPVGVSEASAPSP